MYLCLDQGGHASRALLIDTAGNIHAKAFREIHTQRDANRVEHEPAEIVATLREAAEEVISELGPEAERIDAAGFATQRSSIVCWRQSTGEALSPTPWASQGSTGRTIFRLFAWGQFLLMERLWWC